MAAPHWLIAASVLCQCAGVCACVGQIIEFKVRRHDCNYRGKIISRPAIRLLGRRRVRLIRLGLIVVLLVAHVSFWYSDPVTVGWMLLALWIVDDYVTGRGDWPRWRDKARNRLRKIKPVRLRPVERWKPVAQ